MIKQLVKALKKPRQIPRFLWYKYVKKRVPFTHEEVAPTGHSGLELPNFTARLYEEVKLLNEALGNYRAEKSLEIGCGYGRLTPWIAEHSSQHYAIEPETALLSDAKKLYPNVRFYRAKAQKMPFPDSHFNLCVSWTVLMHIPPQELTRAVAEIKRVCKPKAVLVLCEGVGEYKGSRWGKYWERTLEEWKGLFLPWKLTWHAPFMRDVVMRFEKDLPSPCLWWVRW